MVDRQHDPAKTVNKTSGESRVRLAELVAALSLGIDLGFGQPMEHVLRQCLIALRLSSLAGHDEEKRAAVYYTSLLVNVGCHSDAHEQAKWFSDDIRMKSGKYTTEPGLGAIASMLGLVGAGKTPFHRFRTAVEFFVSGHRDIDGMIASHAKMARTFAERLGLPSTVADGVGSAYEQWDGRGWPGDLAGDAVPTPSRIASIAEFTEVAHRMGGARAAVELAKRRSGKQFDPKLVAIVTQRAHEIFDGLDTVQAWKAVIDAEPALAVVLSEDRFDAALVAVADFVDLKSPYTLGHSRAVADLASATGASLGMSQADLRLLRRAGLVHAFGRLGVSNSILDKPGALGAGEWERVRMHPYLTERMLQHSEVLAPLGAIAVQYRERLDGSGYPRRISGNAISRHARILGAVDAYQAMREPRPHRKAHAPEEAARILRSEARSGRLDGEIVEAVLGAAGHRTLARRERPAGLTAREVEVLRLLARGSSNKQIASALTMTPKTAGNHVEHIYAKIGASNRVEASLFAMQQGLLPASDEENDAS